MRLGIKPLAFFGRALVFFALTYALWTQEWAPIAQYYTQLLAWLVEGFLHLTEISSDPYLHQVSRITADGTAIFFRHRLFPQVSPPGIPAEWVQANLVLLIPLMLATPAPTWAAKAFRFGLAMVMALVLQVLDISITVKAFWSIELGEWSFRYYSDNARWLYMLADAFAQSMDTQLFPFVIWAGIHLRQLIGWERPAATTPQVNRADARRADRQRRKREAA